MASPCPPFVKIRYFPAIAGVLADDSCWLAGFWVLLCLPQVNIITCWLVNFFVNKSKKVWKYGKIIVPLQPKTFNLNF